MSLTRQWKTPAARRACAVSFHTGIRPDNPNREIVYESECLVWEEMVRSPLFVDTGILRRRGVRRTRG